MSTGTAVSMTEGQEEALEALLSIAEASDGALTVDLDYRHMAPYLVVRVYLSAASLRSSEQGIKLQEWEPIDLLIPDDFPYSAPIAWARDDFPEVPHQARGSGFCVRVEDNNWDFTAGMAGYLRAVIDIYQHIALGTVQGHLQPWRPTVHHVAYEDEGCAVIRADLSRTGPVAEDDWCQWAIGAQVSESRVDVIEWLNLAGQTASDLTKTLSGALEQVRARIPGSFLIPAIVIAEPVALEYCGSWTRLLARLGDHGIESAPLLDHLVQATAVNQPSSAEDEHTMLLFRVAPDTEPAAGEQDARFAAARLAQRAIELLVDVQTTDDSAVRRIERLIRVPWIRVYDGRRESVLRRATGRPVRKLAGARILLLGCGGLGAPIAEHCVRSAADRLHIVDSGTVSPGVLSRQPYEDADIGEPKAGVLAARLGRIRPETEITASVADIITADLFGKPELDQYDLVIDATANRSVAARIERAQRDHHDWWPALITVAISQQATHGVSAVTPRGVPGAGVDLLRRLDLRTRVSTALSDVHAAFFPPEADRLNFRPDPTCSDTTFIGSSTDMSALAAQLLHGALGHLDSGPGGDEPPRRSLSIVRLGHEDGLKAARVTLDLPPDRVVSDPGQDYEVRIDQTAMETISEHVGRSVNGRTGGAGLTAGLLLGQFDTACRVAWVSQATGLPPESTASPLNIKRDSDEVRDFLDERRRSSGGLLTLIGFWRSRPAGLAAPGEADADTMRRMAGSPEWRPAPALFLELAMPAGAAVAAFGVPWLPQIHAEVFTSRSQRAEADPAGQ